MVCSSNSMGILGLETFLVKVEADVAMGFPAFDIVGLPDASVKESRDRVKSALRNCGFEIPDGKITINLAPAHIRKEGSVYDLPILIALLKLSGQLMPNIDDSVFIGELSLSGEVRSVTGVLPMAIKAKEEGYKNIYVPYVNKNETAIVKGINVYPVNNLNELYEHLCGRSFIACAKVEENHQDSQIILPDFSQVKGQAEAKRAIEIAAAGMHNILLVGTPGSGKSMLAKRIPSILPDMTFEESIETTKIHSVSGCLAGGASLITQRPFRSPHHTISSVALVGGGANPKPGEISLAHNGVLFLDELPEFNRSVLEVMRQPLEDRKISVARANYKVEYPAGVMFIASMNPCPCGYYNHPTKPCVCNPGQVQRYLNKISGPLLDRIDLQIEIVPVPVEKISDAREGESSAAIRERVIAARKIQEERFKDEPGIYCNAQMPPKLISRYAAIDEACRQCCAQR